MLKLHMAQDCPVDLSCRALTEVQEVGEGVALLLFPDAVKQRGPCLSGPVACHSMHASLGVAGPVLLGYICVALQSEPFAAAGRLLQAWALCCWRLLGGCTAVGHAANPTDGALAASERVYGAVGGIREEVAAMYSDCAPVRGANSREQLLPRLPCRGNPHPQPRASGHCNHPSCCRGGPSYSAGQCCTCTMR
jgi:hypothetical protein